MFVSICGKQLLNQSIYFNSFTMELYNVITFQWNFQPHRYSQQKRQSLNFTKAFNVK